MLVPQRCLHWKTLLCEHLRSCYSGMEGGLSPACTGPDRGVPAGLPSATSLSWRSLLLGGCPVVQEELEASKPQRRKEEQQYAAEAAAARADRCALETPLSSSKGRRQDLEAASVSLPCGVWEILPRTFATLQFRPMCLHKLSVHM